jgi:hypothetical protein
MTGISSEHLFCSSCSEEGTGATYFWVEIFIKQEFFQIKLVFLYPILKLKSIGLDSVDVVLVDVETKH